MTSVTLHHGDMREVLARLKADSVVVQSIVTDPPYHLTSIVKRYGGETATATKAGSAPNHTGAYARASRGFMGKQWDGGDIAFQAETWRLCWELLPPGGHLLAFSGTRTYHRMACAIEDAGFEIRDMDACLLASDGAVQAFLASLNEEQVAAFLRCIEESRFGGMMEWIYGSGFPKSHDVAKGIDARNQHGSARTTDIRRLAMGRDYEPSGRGRANYDNGAGSQMNGGAKYEPQSEHARRWTGWGTAQKPAHEPICVARKPLTGAVAANVLEYGTGALNIDACRIPTDDRLGGGAEKSTTADQKGNAGWTRPWMEDEGAREAHAARVRSNVERSETMGRWPANVVHDGSDEVVSAFPGAPGQLARTSTSTRKDQLVYGAMARGSGGREPRGDAGSAARFFYSSKADADDRLGSKHPTVKPVDLMRWLVRLVTPPGGTVLDPFAGSGTTGMACLAEGFNAILVEREAEYAADIRRRLAHVKGEDTPLFAGASS